MKTLALSLLLLGTSSQPSTPRELLSWYNGWGTHTVWGLGKVSGSYQGTFGKVQIPVRAIYDSHADGSPPLDTQSQDYARSANSATLRSLEADGIRCERPPFTAEA